MEEWISRWNISVDVGGEQRVVELDSWNIQLHQSILSRRQRIFESEYAGRNLLLVLLDILPHQLVPEIHACAGCLHLSQFCRSSVANYFLLACCELRLERR